MSAMLLSINKLIMFLLVCLIGFSIIGSEAHDKPTQDNLNKAFDIGLQRIRDIDSGYESFGEYEIPFNCWINYNKNGNQLQAYMYTKHGSMVNYTQSIQRISDVRIETQYEKILIETYVQVNPVYTINARVDSVGIYNQFTITGSATVNFMIKMYLKEIHDGEYELFKYTNEDPELDVDGHDDVKIITIGSLASAMKNELIKKFIKPENDWFHNGFRMGFGHVLRKYNNYFTHGFQELKELVIQIPTIKRLKEVNYKI